MSPASHITHHSSLSVATLNILNDLAGWPVRAPLIVEELRALQPDLIALQEVALPDNNAQWIADQLGGYSVHLSPKTGRKRQSEALAILSRLPVEAHDMLPLINQDRVAQRVTVRHGPTRWVFANTHLYWNPIDDVPRLEQTRRILDWLPRRMPTIVCGDFNAEPHTISIAAMRQRFASAHEAAHGREPDYTCPTPLHRGPGPRHFARRAAIRLLGLITQRSDAWRGTLDYIFVDPAIRVHHCAIAFQRPAPHDRRIYPSDHLGLTATLQL
jgi:endonuclease/exonuclease/phosphatase family metal-dependent hydrolase